MDPGLRRRVSSGPRTALSEKAVLSRRQTRCDSVIEGFFSQLETMGPGLNGGNPFIIDSNQGEYLHES